MNVAILGSTSHIAKGLISRFLERPQFTLHLYARSTDPVHVFLAQIGKEAGDRCVVHAGYDDFPLGLYDAVINCVGLRAVGKEKVDYASYFTVTEQYDNLILDYLRDRNPEALYVNFSSGAVYGRKFSAPVGLESRFDLAVNAVEPEDYYGVVRLNAEVKHRAFARLRIVDLRVFSYFSRYLDLNDTYFLSDLLRALLENRVLITDDSNMVRDCMHPDELFGVVCRCMELRPLNRALDVRSARPVTKNELLDYFSAAYGLRYERRPALERSSITGRKEQYYSTYDSLGEIGCRPRMTSMETVQQEARYILAGKGSPAQTADGSGPTERARGLADCRIRP